MTSPTRHRPDRAGAAGDCPTRPPRPRSTGHAKRRGCRRSELRSRTWSPRPGTSSCPYGGFLAELLLGECDDRDRRRCAQVKAAGFLREKWPEDFDLDINPASVGTLAAGAWITAGEPLRLIGDSGTGKSHPLIGLGTAARQRFRVRHALATKPANEPAEAADERRLAKTTAHYSRIDLLRIDEFGYREPGRRGAEPLFQVPTEREKTNPIASSQPFPGRTHTFTDPRLRAAIVDRLAFAGDILGTGTTSYRLAHARSATAPSRHCRWELVDWPGVRNPRRDPQPPGPARHVPGRLRQPPHIHHPAR
ncbi:ATP-binding protein [Saccharothrix sp. Mg75]|uniref:ATP-binding protein n=1 Tax=Saccharothrix sp. Mg75 TaxID=3445357 RepID=UPI003EF04512